MPIRIISADAAGRIDGTVKAAYLDRLVARPAPDVTIVPVSNFPDFKFNPELRAVQGKVVVLDFMEYGSAVADPSHRFGHPDVDLPLPGVCVGADEQWEALDGWVLDNDPSVYFKRELNVRNVTRNVRPIDWPALQPAPPIETRAEFDARPVEVFHCWGYSNALRTKLHADIFEAMGTRGIAVHDRVDRLCNFIAKSSGRRWVSAYVPWWERHQMADVMSAQRHAKISVSLPGFGLKCFRHSEAPVGAVMAITDDALAWSFPWEHGVNCVQSPRDTFMSGLLDALRWNDWHKAFSLYDCYRAGQETVDRYRPDRYVDEYLLPLIREAVG